MNFEEAYQKLKNGTATDEEAAFVARELENVRKISAILDNPDLSDPDIRKAETQHVQEARKAFNRRTTIHTITVVLCILLIIAAIICSVLLIPSSISASGKLKISKEQAIESAYTCLVEEIGAENAEEYFLDYAHRHLRYTGSIFQAVYVYKVEYENPFGKEYEIEVNGSSGYTRITDID